MSFRSHQAKSNSREIHVDNESLPAVQWFQNTTKEKNTFLTSFLLVPSILVLYVLQSTILNLYFLSDGSWSLADGVRYSLSSYLFIATDGLILLMILYQLCANDAASHISNVMMIYLISIGVKSITFNNLELLTIDGPSLLISPQLGKSFWNCSNAICCTSLIYWLSGLISIHANFDKCFISMVPEGCVAVIFLIKTSIDLFDISILPDMINHMTEFPYSLRPFVNAVLLIGYSGHSVSLFGRFDGPDKKDWLFTAKHSLIISMVVIDIPCLIMRSTYLCFDWKLINSELWIIVGLIKNIVCIPLSLILFHQLRLIETDELKMMYRRFERHAKKKQSDVSNKHQLIYDESALSSTVILDSFGDDSFVFSEDYTDKEIYRLRVGLAKEISDSRRGLSSHALRQVMHQISNLRRLPVKPIPWCLSGFKLLDGIFSAAFKPDLSSIIDANVDVRHFRRIIIVFSVLVSLLQPLAIYVIEFFVLKCYSNGGQSSNDCVQRSYRYWQNTPNDLSASFLTFWCFGNRRCQSMYWYLGTVVVAQFFLFIVNTPITVSLLQCVYLFIQYNTYWASLLGMRWLGVFDRSIIIVFGGRTFQFHVELAFLFLLCVPSLLASLSISLEFIGSLFGLTHLSYHNGAIKCDLSNCVESYSTPKGEDATYHDVSHHRVDFVTIACYYGIKHHILPATINEVIIGDDIIKSLRCMDAIQLNDWFSILANILFRNTILSTVSNWPFWMLMVVDTVMGITYASVSHSVRLLSLRRHEIKLIFKYAVERRLQDVKPKISQFDESSRIDQMKLILAMDPVKQIMAEGFFTDHSSFLPAGMF
eukprot:GHVH01002087.1.p1 GENE.GHVH01002087.1~~GHVH01002087.1.p1  ORF type:complete len:821 (-),score=69.38 GHVH01002087.1:2773-5235(-)